MLRKLRSCVSLGILKTVYFSQIHSHLAYGTVLWGGTGNSLKLFKLQKKAVRLLYSLPPRSHCKPSFKSLKIMTLPAIFVFQCLIYIKENRENYPEHSKYHPYNTKNKNNLVTAHYNYSKTQKSFLGISVKLFNHIPITLREVKADIFKRKLKLFLLENPIYSIEEFYELTW